LKIRTKYFIYIAVLHLIILALSFNLLKSVPELFVLIEVLLLFLLLYALRLYKKMIRPIDLIVAGANNLRDQEFNSRIKKTGQPDLDRLIEIYNLMSEKLHSEQRHLQEKHFFLEKLIASSPSGIIIFDLDEKISALNPAAARMLKIGDQSREYLHKSLREINHPLAVQLAELQTGEAKVINLQNILLYQCQKAHFLDRGFKNCFIIIEELSEAVFRIEKSAYEKIIRIMSHEINNSIGAINSILESFKYYSNQLKLDDQVDFNNALTVSIERNSSLNQFMSNYAGVIRLPEANKQNADLTALIRSVLLLYKQSLADLQIELQTDFPPDPVDVKIDKIQIEQALVNILKNSLEAIAAKAENGGRILISLQRSENQRVNLKITDNGTGVSSSVQADLFKPFYSSKKYGQGIGLTLVKEILLNHQCNFSLTTESSSGLTVFDIDFS